MEKGKLRGISALGYGLLVFLAIALCAGLLFAVQSGSTASCSTLPKLELGKSSVASSPGTISTVELSVTGTQDASCGAQLYGVDFTNGYDGSMFVFAIKGVQDRNVFSLQPGQTKTFVGFIGVPPSTPAGNYSIQATAYREDDHWKQASKAIGVTLVRESDSDAYWKTGIGIGWNLVPNIEGIGVYGCPGINTAYRYSSYKGDYITLNRYGPVFVPAPFEADMPNEQFGGLFVFSTQKCTLESRVPMASYGNAEVSLLEGQLLSVPPAWHGAPLSSLKSACASQSANGSGTLDAKLWDAPRQQWVAAPANHTLVNGEVLRLVPNFDCSLNLQNGEQ